MRRRVSIFLLFGLLLVLAGLLGRLYLHQQLQRAGVSELTWAGPGWHSGALTLDELTLTLDNGSTFELQQLALAPGWRSGVMLKRAEADRLVLNLPAAEQAPSAAETDSPLVLLGDETFWRTLARWLPDSARLQQIQATLPCRTGQCLLAGSWRLDSERSVGSTTLSSQLLLDLEGQQLALSPRLQLDAERVALQAALAIDGLPAARLDSQWQQGHAWQGQLAIPDWPQTPWLFGYLGRWLTLGALPFEQMPTAAQADLSWQLHPAEKPARVEDWLGGAVALQANVLLPEPWAIAGVGSLTGKLSLQLSGDQGRWALPDAQLNMVLVPDLLAALQQFPSALQPAQVALRLQPASEQQLVLGQPLALQLSADATLPSGGTAQLDGPLQVQGLADWQINSDALLVQLQLPRLALPELAARSVTARLPLQLQANARSATIGLSKAGELGWQRLQLPAAELALTATSARVGTLAITLPLDEGQSASATGELAAEINRVEHAQLKPQSWSLSGDWEWQDGGLVWRGQVANAAGLHLDHQANVSSNGQWQLDGTLAPIYFRAGNPLEQTLASWPALLSLSSGQLDAELQAGDSGKGLRARLSARLSGAKGIYDRTAFSGLTTPVQVSLQGDRFSAVLADLEVGELNAGIPAGPLQASLDYQGALAHPTTGTLEARRLTLELLGGRVSLTPATLDLAQPEQHAELVLQGLELGRLFEVYPTEGLSGGGTLDGRLPVLLRDGQLLVDQGAVAARAPGGVLRYQSDKLQRLAASNPSMRELAGALEEFHYTVLSSQVELAEGGDLTLALRLQGSNPDFQQGRQVNLNINLQENIPALLASLQLSGKVSDIIEQRVQQYLLKRRIEQP